MANYIHIFPENLFLENENDYSLQTSLILTSSTGNCLSDQIHRKRFWTCSCDAHCSLDLCRSSTPPSDCLPDTDTEWTFDVVKNVWVAQKIRGIKIYHTYVLYRLCKLILCFPARITYLIYVLHFYSDTSCQ